MGGLWGRREGGGLWVWVLGREGVGVGFWGGEGRRGRGLFFFHPSFFSRGSASERDYQRHVRNPTAMEVTNHCVHGRDLPTNTWGRPHSTSQQHNSKYSPISVSKAMRARTCKTCGTERFGCGQTGQEMVVSRPTPSDLACDDHQAGTTAHSGQFRTDLSFRRLASLKATPSRTVAPGLGVPSAMGGHPQRFPTCGRQRGRANSGQGLVQDVHPRPCSSHSNANPRRPNTPETAHAER